MDIQSFMKIRKLLFSFAKGIVMVMAMFMPTPQFEQGMKPKLKGDKEQEAPTKK